MRYVIIFLFLTALLSFRFWQTYHNTSNYINGQKLDFQTSLSSQPRQQGTLQSFSVQEQGKSRIFVTTGAFPQLTYGDSVHISGIVKEKVLNNKKTVFTSYFPKIEAVKKPKNPLLSITMLIRQKVTSLFVKILPLDLAYLLLGIVFGIKENMSKEFYSQLQSTGVLHVVAASGMNVSMVGGFLAAVFTKLLRRQIALLVSMVGIMFYALLAGLEASILRAALMGSVAFTAQILGKQYLAAYVLFLVGYGMLFFSPELLFDIGFQLSFLATLGLLYIKLPLQSDITTSISAQIATVPILLANFGSYSLFSILVNGLVLWTVPILMSIGGIGAVVGIIFEPLGRIIVLLCLPFLMYFEMVVSFFSRFGGRLEVQSFPLSLGIGYYLILISLVILSRRQRIS